MRRSWTGSWTARQVQHAPIHDQQRAADHQRAENLVGLQHLAQGEMPEQDRRQRQQQRHQHHVGGARARQDLEEHDIGQRRRQGGEAEQRRPCRNARHRQGPRPFDRAGQHGHHQAGRNQLASRRGQRRHAGQAPPAPQSGEAVARRRAQAEQHAEPLTLGQRESLAAQDGDAAKPDQDAHHASGDQAFLARHRQHQHGEQWRGGVQHRGQAAGDLALAGDDQRERDHVVQQAHHHEGHPPAERARQCAPGRPQQRQQQHRGDRHARQHDGQRRQFLDRDAGEEERAAPQQRQQQEQQPVARIDPSGHRDGIATRRAGVDPVRAVAPPYSSGSSGQIGRRNLW